MANSEPVRVAVEIIDKFSDELTELETRLEKIDGKTLDVDLDIDDGRLEEIEARLEKLEEDINTTLKIKTKGYGKAKAQKEDLEKDMFSTLHVGVDKDRLRGLGNLNGGEGFNPPLGSGKGGGSLAALTGLESVDLGDDVFSHVFENLQAVHGTTDQAADSARRFSPNEQRAINDFLLNPSVAKAHNRGIPKGKRDGWIGPSNWAFGIGEKWGPEPRYAGDKKIGPGTDFLRGIRKMTDSWSDLKSGGLGINVDKADLNLDTGIGSRNAAEIDFLRGINRATTASRAARVGDNLFGDSKFGSLPFNARGFDPDLFFPKRGSGQYPWSLPQRIGRRAGRAYGRARFGMGNVLGGIRSKIPSGGDIAGSKFFQERQFKAIGETIRKFLPTDMRKWYTLLAMVLPLIIALAGAAMGLVAAFGALATAGIAITGIGLLGWGDDAESSIRNVKRRLGELKSELFEVLQPAANIFQPFTAQLFDSAPGMVQNLVDPLMALAETGYDDWWLESLEGASRWFADLLWAASKLAPQIQAIGTAFGRAFGDWLIGFLTRMTTELYENWDMWARLTRSFLAIINLIYELSKILAFMVALLEPFFIMLGKITDLVGNDFLTALLMAVAAMWALDFALAAVAAKAGYATFAKMATGLWAAAAGVGGLTGALASLKAWLMAINAQLTLANILTGGLLAITGLVVGGIAYSSLKNSGTASDSVGGRGVPASRPTGAGAGGGTQINIYGDVGNREYQKMRDQFPDLYAEQRSIEKNTEK
jgi:hypothetical protein